MDAPGTRPRFQTFLSPGQRFHATDSHPEELTVARLVTDRFGLLHVTLRSADGREVSAFAEQVESAIAEGHLMPAMAALGGLPALSA